jgi:hypothetical protein
MAKEAPIHIEVSGHTSFLMLLLHLLSLVALCLLLLNPQLFEIHIGAVIDSRSVSTTSTMFVAESRKGTWSNLLLLLVELSGYGAEEGSLGAIGLA